MRKKDKPYERLKRKEITQNEYNNLLAKKRGFKNRVEQDKFYLEKRGFKTYKDYEVYLVQQKGFSNIQEYKEFFVQEKGFNDYKEYRNFLVQKRGFKNESDYVSSLNYKRGKCKPMSENKQSSQYLGIFIAERVLSHVFDNVTRMPNNNPDYDFICHRGYKINVKSACITKNNLTRIWNFSIKKNIVSDYFLLLAFDNRDDLTPMHIWLIKGTEIIGVSKKVIVNKKASLHICNTSKSIKEYDKYEIKDKLDKVIECCVKLKEEKNNV